MKKNTVFLLMGAAIVLASWFVMNANKPSVEKDVKASYLKGGDFTLSNEGQTFELESLRGQAVVLYFGFTSCPDVCPVGLSVIRDAFKMLDSESSDTKVKGVFVTLDPERDTSEKLADYVGFFHESIQGVTGTLQEINAVAKMYGTYFKKSGTGENGDYSVDHTAYFYIIDREGELIRVLDHGTKSEEIFNILGKL